MKPMDLLISNPKEIEQLVNNAVYHAVSKVLPEVFRKMHKKPIYSNDEVCELLKVSKRHLQYLRDTGQINFVQNGRKIYYRAEDLENFFNMNRIASEVKNG